MRKERERKRRSTRMTETGKQRKMKDTREEEGAKKEVGGKKKGRQNDIKREKMDTIPADQRRGQRLSDPAQCRSSAVRRKNPS